MPDRGRGQSVAVVGEPGVGKSRLYYDFIHSHRVQGWLILESGSVWSGKATPYLPLADLLRDYFKIDSARRHSRHSRKVTGGLLTLDEALKDTVAVRCGCSTRCRKTARFSRWIRPSAGARRSPRSNEFCCARTSSIR